MCSIASFAIVHAASLFLRIYTQGIEKPDKILDTFLYKGS